MVYHNYIFLIDTTISNIIQLLERKNYGPMGIIKISRVKQYTPKRTYDFNIFKELNSS